MPGVLLVFDGFDEAIKTLSLPAKSLLIFPRRSIDRALKDSNKIAAKCIQSSRAAVLSMPDLPDGPYR
jgi:hypothetical protein